jgi:serine phosphatase RsbU (regulator of sigma subunit)
MRGHGATTRTANVAELLHREALWLVHCSHSVTDVHSRRIPVGMFKEVTTWVLQLLLKH